MHIAVERSEQLDPDSAIDFDPNAPFWPVPNIAYGVDLRLRVEARAGGLVLARGRSFPFAMQGPDDRPSADVWLGTLGRFGEVHSGLDVRALTANPRGALGVDGAGARIEILAHGAEGVSVDRTPADLDGLQWVPGRREGLFGVAGDRWVHVGPDGFQAESRATGFEPGSALASTDEGVVVARLDGGLEVLVGVPGASTRRPLEPLPGPFSNVRAAAVPVGEATRIVVLADRALFVVDPSGDRPTARVEGAAASGASLAPLAAGLVAVFGGTGEDGPVAEVLLLVLGGERPQVLRPPALFEARVDPAVVQIREGLLLIAGGRGADGPLSSAELLQVGLADLPGDVAVTGSLPWPMASPRGARLADGSVLILGAEGGALYFDPRDPAP